MYTKFIEILSFAIWFCCVQTAPVLTKMEVQEAQEYLRLYGYAPTVDAGKSGSVTNESQSKAIKSFQRVANLEITGELDQATLAKMSEKRCGNKDINIVSKYSIIGWWRKTSLTYKINKYTPDLTKAEVDFDISEGFKMWSDKSKLSFQQVNPNEKADIEISFETGDHGDGSSFDGTRVLAHAFFGGDVHFNEAYSWKTACTGGYENLKLVAAHEFGHSLGIGHSDVKDAIMWPYFGPSKTELHQDDIEAIQLIYGKNVEKPDTTTNTTTTLRPPTDACSGSISTLTRLDNLSRLTIASGSLIMMLYFTTMGKM